MALAKRLQQPTEEKDTADITLNLSTLQFESALNEEEQQLQYLRKQAHALAVTSCAQATFLVQILNEARQQRRNLKSPLKRSTRILQEQTPRDPLKVGILGCGRLGSQLADCFITYGNINPRDLKVSTRRPETLEYLLNKGVDCFHDNIKLVTTCHIVFLCVLPSQVPAIADEVKAEVPSTLFLYSFPSTVTAKKLKQLFGTSSVIHPEFTWDRNLDFPWDYTMNMSTALSKQHIVEATCPLRKEKGVINTNRKLAELIIFVFINMCTHLRLTKFEALDLLHALVFSNTEEGRLEINDFVRKSADKDELFPPFDLSKVMESNTAVLKRLNQYPALSEAYTATYCQIFEEYVKQKQYNDMYKG